MLRRGARRPGSGSGTSGAAIDEGRVLYVGSYTIGRAKPVSKPEQYGIMVDATSDTGSYWRMPNDAA